MFDHFFLQFFGPFIRSPLIKFSASLAYTKVSFFCPFAAYHSLKPSSSLTPMLATTVPASTSVPPYCWGVANVHYLFK